MKKSLLLVLAMFISFAFAQNSFAQSCDIMDGFRTQTIGGWGASPSGNNPGSYLHANFDNAFMEGLVVGSGDLTVTFTSAQAITDYLPAGSTPSKLKKSYMDPSTNQLKNVLVSQTVALTLSVTFSDSDPNFDETSTRLGDLEIAYGAFEGKTVREMLAIANAALAGEGDYSLSEVNEAITAINENFVDGDVYDAEGMVVIGDFLECPMGGGSSDPGDSIIGG